MFFFTLHYITIRLQQQRIPNTL